MGVVLLLVVLYFNSYSVTLALSSISETHRVHYGTRLATNASNLVTNRNEEYRVVFSQRSSHREFAVLRQNMLGIWVVCRRTVSEVLGPCLSSLVPKQGAALLCMGFITTATPIRQ